MPTNQEEMIREYGRKKYALGVEVGNPTGSKARSDRLRRQSRRLLDKILSTLREETTDDG